MKVCHELQFFRKNVRLSTWRTKDNVQAVLNLERLLSVPLITERISFDKTMHNIIFENLVMMKICAKLVLKVLLDLLKHVGENSGVLEDVTSGTTVGFLNTTMKQCFKVANNIQYGTSSRRKARMPKSSVKALLISFIAEGLVYMCILGADSEWCFHLDVLRRLRRRVNRVRPAIVGNWKLHHLLKSDRPTCRNNSEPSRNYNLTQFQSYWALIYKTDPSLKDTTTGPRLLSKTLARELSGIRVLAESLQSHWQRCVNPQGCYFSCCVAIHEINLFFRNICRYSR